MKISVVSPFYNEEAIVAESARTMVSCLEGAFDDWELILVDDGSTDGSLAVLSASLASSNRVRILTYKQNRGRGHALKTGIDAARGEIIVTTEADLSWGADIVERLVAAITADASVDVVVASVHMPGGGLVNVTPKRVLLTRLGNQLIRTFVSRRLTMYTGMTRAYRCDVIKPLPISEYGKEFHLETLLKLDTLGFEIREIPATITWPARKACGKSRKSSTNIQKTILTHLRFAVLGRPSQYFATCAALSLIAGGAFLGVAVLELASNGVAAFVALVGILMCISSLLFAGFAALFSHLSEVMCNQWASAYPQRMPSLVAGRKIHEVSPGPR